MISESRRAEVEKVASKVPNVSQVVNDLQIYRGQFLPRSSELVEDGIAAGVQGAAA
ncbi:MAG TPA: hypothetical protein VIY66_01145 [Candidatus Acidoferrales bacterium]